MDVPDQLLAQDSWTDYPLAFPVMRTSSLRYCQLPITIEHEEVSTVIKVLEL